MLCHEFKGGIGTASRVLRRRRRLHGRRPGPGELRQARMAALGGVPVGGPSRPPRCPARTATRPPSPPAGSGSMIVVVATDARCCRTSASGWRNAPARHRPGGGTGATRAATCSLLRDRQSDAVRIGRRVGPTGSRKTRSTRRRHVTPLFYAVVEATEEAIVNALVAAKPLLAAMASRPTRSPTIDCVEVFGSPPADRHDFVLAGLTTPRRWPRSRWPPRRQWGPPRHRHPTLGIPGSRADRRTSATRRHGRASPWPRTTGRWSASGPPPATRRFSHLADLFVRPERQGQGIGRRLLEAIIDGTPPLLHSPRTTHERCPFTSGPGWTRGGPTCTSPGTWHGCPPRRMATR